MSHKDGCPCASCEDARATPGDVTNGAHARRVVSVSGGAELVQLADRRPPPPGAARMVFACDCGSEVLSRFGPYKDSADQVHDKGLRWVFTCTKCGEQLRVYATSPASRLRRAKHDDLGQAAAGVVAMAREEGWLDEEGDPIAVAVRFLALAEVEQR